ncbi:hypothetical protein FGO68_gene1786 [Halteria grandinella]|uniref:Uncharacterized protein n=1 Tax=Halteria grandinella TaxID=5974 RepID=A0A8J8SVR7_HALGN|nr:hypothetical protein FGO68_gene1786 [Halteria grandinella]
MIEFVWPLLIIFSNYHRLIDSQRLIQLQYINWAPLNVPQVSLKGFYSCLKGTLLKNLLALSLRDAKLC